jgi:hypothetical protein
MQTEQFSQATTKPMVAEAPQPDFIDQAAQIARAALEAHEVEVWVQLSPDRPTAVGVTELVDGKRKPLTLVVLPGHPTACGMPLAGAAHREFESVHAEVKRNNPDAAKGLAVRLKTGHDALVWLRLDPSGHTAAGIALVETHTGHRQTLAIMRGLNHH